MSNSNSGSVRRGAPRPRLSPHSRLVMVERVAAGQSKTAVAAQMGCSRQTVDKWVSRYEAEGRAGLEDRSSRPLRSPTRTAERVEQKICRLRRSKRLGPARLAGRVGVPASTVHRVLCRHGLNRLAWIDRPTGERVRRYEKAHAGELVHIDVSKVAKVPPPRRRPAGPRPRLGQGQTRQAQTAGIHLPARRRRRPLPRRLHRGPRQRQGRDSGSVLAQRPRLVQQAQRRHRRRHDRQRQELHLGQVRRGARREPHQTPPHPPLPAPDQRQSRAAQPHPRRRALIHPGLGLSGILCKRRGLRVPGWVLGAGKDHVCD